MYVVCCFNKRFGERWRRKRDDGRAKKKTSREEITPIGADGKLAIGNGDVRKKMLNDFMKSVCSNVCTEINENRFTEMTLFAVIDQLNAKGN